MVNFGPPYPESVLRAKMILGVRLVPYQSLTINIRGKYPIHFPGKTEPVVGWLVGDGNPCLYFTVNNIARWIDARDNSVEWIHAWNDDTGFHIDSCQFFSDFLMVDAAVHVNKSWYVEVPYGVHMYDEEIP